MSIHDWALKFEAAYTHLHDTLKFCVQAATAKLDTEEDI